MSVWKKAAKANQKEHRERHQPESRKHLGLLEKKKDYVKRARDYNEKQETLKLLHKRVLNRNPEEFYHHMINSKVNKDGVHHEKDTQTDRHTKEQIKLMETQDTRYIHMKRLQEMKRVEKLQSQLHLVDVKCRPKNSHKYFLDSSDFKNEKQRLIDERKNNITTSLQHIDPEILKTVTKKRENMYQELAARIQREQKLSVVQHKIEIKKYLQTKKKSLPPRKIVAATSDTAPIYKWKSQRKR